MNYAEGVVERLEEERAPAPKSSDSRTSLSPFDNIRNTMTETNTINWVVRDETETRRVAFSNMEVRASEDGTKLVGYAAVFDSPSEPLPFTEFVRRGAFTKTLNDGADVRLLIDHEGVPLARTKSGTLVLTEDDRGLLVESDLDPMNPDAARLISALRRGDISQMSFAFRTVKDNWSDDRRTRELREVQLFDVSVVTFPAYESTVAELRAMNEVANIELTNTLSLRKRQIEIARHK
jgi:HK97 family phage prohead protease